MVEGNEEEVIKDNTLTVMREHYIENMAHLINLRKEDNMDEQRQRLAKDLALKVQRRLEELQNPNISCSKARFIVCDNRKNGRGGPVCGWGCMIDHAQNCFQIAILTGRILVLDESFYG